MHNLNPELLKQRMMRGALTGPAAPEKEPMKYCKGKLDNGKGCKIVMVGGKEYCQRHQKEIDALEAGEPLEPGRVEREIPADTLQQDEELPADIAAFIEAVTFPNIPAVDDTETCCLECGGPVTNQDLFCQKCAVQQSSTEVDPPPVLTQVLPRSGSPLSRLLRPIPVPTPGIIIPFAQEEMVALSESEISAEDIRQLTLYLLAGELQRIA